MIDSLREKGKWEDVKKQHKVYVKNMKQHKAFKSKYAKEEERLAYAEVVGVVEWDEGADEGRFVDKQARSRSQCVETHPVCLGCLS